MARYLTVYRPMSSICAVDGGEPVSRSSLLAVTPGPGASSIVPAPGVGADSWYHGARRRAVGCSHSPQSVLMSAATETCGQLCPRKLRRTVWVYCSCRHLPPDGSAPHESGSARGRCRCRLMVGARYDVEASFEPAAGQVRQWIECGAAFLMRRYGSERRGGLAAQRTDGLTQPGRSEAGYRRLRPLSAIACLLRIMRIGRHGGMCLAPCVGSNTCLKLAG
jgi:hypothetical protein